MFTSGCFGGGRTRSKLKFLLFAFYWHPRDRVRKYVLAARRSLLATCQQKPSASMPTCPLQRHFPPAELEPEGICNCHFALPGLSAPAAAVAEALQHSRDFDEQLEHPMLDESPRSYSLNEGGRSSQISMGRTIITTAEPVFHFAVMSISPM